MTAPRTIPTFAALGPTSAKVGNLAIRGSGKNFKGGYLAREKAGFVASALVVVDGGMTA